jgi:hypothetical protein
MITLRQTLARTATQKVSTYIPHTGMAGMLLPPSIGVNFEAPIRWLYNRTTLAILNVKPGTVPAAPGLTPFLPDTKCSEVLVVATLGPISSHECVDDQDYNDGAKNEHPIGNLNARYSCFPAKPFHDFPPR